VFFLYYIKEKDVLWKTLLEKESGRVDGYEKVTGKVIYGDDLKFPGILYVSVPYTDIPAGKITKLDISFAEKIKKFEAPFKSPQQKK
jgi:CO/xanthine dehydrogenase Mo-binding subunit